MVTKKEKAILVGVLDYYLSAVGICSLTDKVIMNGTEVTLRDVLKLKQKYI